MRVIVCGGRDYADQAKVFAELDVIYRSVPLDSLMVIQGGAAGADALARAWCLDRHVEYANVPADWKAYGKRAGPLRNLKMVTKYRPHLVLAFPGGRGTADMVKQATEAGVEVRAIDPGQPTGEPHGVE